jgi:3-deoxy-manno-octulosonate cytidylyltransferase (CMP-KDO synthetase)
MNTPAKKRSEITIVIPARLASTRLPRKLLLRETGKTLIQHTYEAAQKATLCSAVIVATDHEEILREVESFGGRAVMTSPECASGTDRVAEVARQLPEVELLVNVQGDEPEISGESIDLAVRLLERNPEAVMSTLATPIRGRSQFEDPACVKVVFRSAQFLSARRPLCLPPRFSASVGEYAAVANRKDRKAGAASRSRSRSRDSRGRGR